MLKKHILRKTRGNPIENYFRFWKKQTNIELKRYKIQKLKEL
jgi:hypothetical protein